MEALYLKIPRDCGRAEGALKSLLELAQNDSARDWNTICCLVSRCVEEYGPAASLDPTVVDQLADLRVYVELDDLAGGNRVRCRPTIQRLKRDAQNGRFRRLVVSSVPSLGMDIREVVSVVCSLLDFGLTIIPAQPDAECVEPGMAGGLRQVMNWSREIEHRERSVAVRAGQSRALSRGKRVGRPRRIFDRQEVLRLRDEEHLSWSQIAKTLAVGAGTARRAYEELATDSRPAENIKGAA